MLKDINKSGLPAYNIPYIKVQFSLAWEKKNLNFFSYTVPLPPPQRTNILVRSI